MVDVKNNSAKLEESLGLRYLIQTQVFEDFADDVKFLNAGNDARGPATLLAFLNFNGEDTFQAPRPRHRASLGLLPFFLFD